MVAPCAKPSTNGSGRVCCVQIEWANEHPREAYQIMVNAATLAREMFRPDEVACYTGLLLTAYARLLAYRPDVRLSMTHYKYPVSAMIHDRA
jgi:hypothetical protein